MNVVITIPLIGFAMFVCVTVQASTPAFEPLFSGHDLSGWVNVNTDKDTWTAETGVLHCSGSTSGILRTASMYENYVLEFEWFSVNGRDLPEVLVHTDALPAVGSPFPKGIKGPSDQAACVGFLAVNGAQIEHSGSTGPVADRSGLWNHYRLESQGGELTVAVNGRDVARGTAALPRKGYIAFASSGAVVAYRNIRLAPLPSNHPSENQIAAIDEGFVSLFSGSLDDHWEMKPGHIGHWKAEDWLIDYDGSSAEKDKCLWSKASFSDFVLTADVRFTREPQVMATPVVTPGGEDATHADGTKVTVDLPYFGDTGIYVRGDSKNQINIGNRYIGSGEIYGYRVDRRLPAEVRASVTPSIKADKPAGEWNRFVITLIGDRITVVVNGQVVIDRAELPGIAEAGRIALQDDHWDNNLFQFANLFIKPLDGSPN